jgi:hypothetical protein
VDETPEEDVEAVDKGGRQLDELLDVLRDAAEPSEDDHKCPVIEAAELCALLPAAPVPREALSLLLSPSSSGASVGTKGS